MTKMNLTDDEAELIMAIRNYRKAFPDGQYELLWYAQQRFDELTTLP